MEYKEARNWFLLAHGSGPRERDGLLDKRRDQGFGFYSWFTNIRIPV